MLSDGFRPSVAEVWEGVTFALAHPQTAEGIRAAHVRSERGWPLVVGQHGKYS